MYIGGVVPYCRYAACSPSGSLSVLLCPDGLVLDPAQGKCDYPAKVRCGDRTLLQVLIFTQGSNYLFIL